MTVPAGSGVPAAANIPIFDNILFPQWLSAQLILAWRRKTVIDRITTTDYTAQLKKGGNSVDIPVMPKANIRAYVKGATTIIDQVEPTTVTLNIDKAYDWAFPIYDVDRVQVTHKDFWTKMAAETGKDLAEYIESEYFSSIIASAHASNTGATAGLKSGAYNLGTALAPVTPTSSTIVNTLLGAGGALDEQDADVEGVNRYLVISPYYAQMIKESDYGKTYITGDRTSPLRNGELGRLDRFTVFVSNRLPISNGVTPVIFGTKDAVIFFTQMTDEKKVQGQPDLHSEAWIGLQVYGYLAHRTEGLGVMYLS